MKNVIMFLIVVISVCFTQVYAQAQNSKFKIGDTLFVCAYNGLNLRDAATTNSNVILRLDHADLLTVLDVEAATVEIEHRESSWLKVDVNGYTGYLFGGYLSTTEPMYLDAASFDCNTNLYFMDWVMAVSYTHLRAHETEADLVCRLLLEKKK